MKKNNVYTYVLVCAAIILVFLVSCGSGSDNVINTTDDNYSVTTLDNTRMYVVRHIDEDAGVVCWIYSAVGQGGIDCLPIDDTLLKNR